MFTLLQVHNTLKLMAGPTSVATLTLPAGITVSEFLKPRFAVARQLAIVTNSPSRPVTVDASGTVRVLTPLPPASAVTIAGAAGGTLSGTFKVKQTYRIRDAAGNILAESGFGPVSNTTSITSQWLRITNIPLSSDQVTSSMFYRTTSNGAVFFPWYEIDGNTQTTGQDDLSDAALSLFAANNLGSAPVLANAVEYQGRIWGVDRTAIDELRYSEAGLIYAWPLENSILSPRPGSDLYGITGLLPRREALGIARQNMFAQLTGSGSDFALLIIDENVGVMSQESIAVWRDTSYFLAHDGVYKWDGNGLDCVSDGKVRSWFNTNRFFDRSKFNVAFAQLDTIRQRYRLFLCSPGSSLIDRWVEYDINEHTWWGPHKTQAFYPSCAFSRTDSSNVIIPTIGSGDGYLWQDQDPSYDNTSGIDWKVTTKRHDGNDPRTEKVWGRPMLIQVAQPAGSMTVTPLVGELTAPGGPGKYARLTIPAQKLTHLGRGKHAGMIFQNTVPGQNVKLLGYELDFVDTGTRL